MEILRRQRAAASRLAASRLADCKNMRRDLDVANSTISHNNTALRRVLGGSARLQVEVGGLSSERASA